MTLYDAQDSEDEMSLKGRTWKEKIMNPIAIVAILAILGMIAFHGRLQPISFDRAFFYGAGLIVVAIFAKLSWVSFKNATPKLIFQGGNTTTMGEPETVGNWHIWRAGDVKAIGLYFKGSEGTIIAPITSTNPIGRNVALTVRPEIVKFDELSLTLQNFISQHGKEFKPPYYMGFASEEQLLNKLEIEEKELGLVKPTVEYCVREIKERCKEVSLLKGLLESKFGVIENTVAFTDRLKKLAREKTMGELMRDKIMKKEEE